MVTLGRFELPTCGLGNRRSIHLSYRATCSHNQRTCKAMAVAIGSCFPSLVAKNAARLGSKFLHLALQRLANSCIAFFSRGNGLHRACVALLGCFEANLIAFGPARPIDKGWTEAGDALAALLPHARVEDAVRLLGE